VRRLFTWVAGAAGGLAAYKAATRRKIEVHAEPEAAVVQPDPAEELRAKLAETRAVEPEPRPEPEPEAEGADARRRAVHDRARSALDEMRGGDP
jgi:hypothetical protein